METVSSTHVPLSPEKIRALHGKANPLCVSSLYNKTTLLSHVELVWFGDPNDTFPFLVDPELNMAGRMAFSRAMDKLPVPVFRELPALTKSIKVTVGNVHCGYCEVRGLNDMDLNVKKTVEYLIQNSWVGVVHISDGSKLYLIPTSSLSQELGITHPGYPKMLHGLFVKKENQRRESFQSPMAESKHPLRKSVLENHPLDQEMEPLGTGRKRRRVTFAADPPSTLGSSEAETVREGSSGETTSSPQTSPTERRRSKRVVSATASMAVVEEGRSLELAEDSKTQSLRGKRDTSRLTKLLEKDTSSSSPPPPKIFESSSAESAAIQQSTEETPAAFISEKEVRERNEQQSDEESILSSISSAASDTVKPRRGRGRGRGRGGRTRRGRGRAQQGAQEPKTRATRQMRHRRCRTRGGANVMVEEEEAGMGEGEGTTGEGGNKRRRMLQDTGPMETARSTNLLLYQLLDEQATQIEVKEQPNSQEDSTVTTTTPPVEDMKVDTAAQDPTRTEQLPQEHMTPSLPSSKPPSSLPLQQAAQDTSLSATGEGQAGDTIQQRFVSEMSEVEEEVIAFAIPFGAHLSELGSEVVAETTEAPPRPPRRVSLAEYIQRNKGRRRPTIEDIIRRTRDSDSSDSQQSEQKLQPMEAASRSVEPRTQERLPEKSATVAESESAGDSKQATKSESLAGVSLLPSSCPTLASAVKNDSPKLSQSIEKPGSTPITKLVPAQESSTSPAKAKVATVSGTSATVAGSTPITKLVPVQESSTSPAKAKVATVSGTSATVARTNQAESASGPKTTKPVASAKIDKRQDRGQKPENKADRATKVSENTKSETSTTSTLSANSPTYPPITKPITISSPASSSPTYPPITKPITISSPASSPTTYPPITKPITISSPASSPTTYPPITKPITISSPASSPTTYPPITKPITISSPASSPTTYPPITKPITISSPASSSPTYPPITKPITISSSAVPPTSYHPPIAKPITFTSSSLPSAISSPGFVFSTTAANILAKISSIPVKTTSQPSLRDRDPPPHFLLHPSHHPSPGPPPPHHTPFFHNSPGFPPPAPHPAPTSFYNPPQPHPMPPSHGYNPPQAPWGPFGYFTQHSSFAYMQPGIHDQASQIFPSHGPRAEETPPPPPKSPEILPPLPPSSPSSSHSSVSSRSGTPTREDSALEKLRNLMQPRIMQFSGSDGKGSLVLESMEDMAVDKPTCDAGTQVSCKMVSQVVQVGSGFKFRSMSTQTTKLGTSSVSLQVNPKVYNKRIQTDCASVQHSSIQATVHTKNTSSQTEKKLYTRHKNVQTDPEEYTPTLLPLPPLESLQNMMGDMDTSKIDRIVDRVRDWLINQLSTLAGSVSDYELVDTSCDENEDDVFDSMQLTVPSPVISGASNISEGELSDIFSEGSDSRQSPTDKSPMSKPYSPSHPLDPDNYVPDHANDGDPDAPPPPPPPPPAHILPSSSLVPPWKPVARRLRSQFSCQLLEAAQDVAQGGEGSQGDGARFAKETQQTLVAGTQTHAAQFSGIDDTSFPEQQTPRKQLFSPHLPVGRSFTPLLPLHEASLPKEAEDTNPQFEDENAEMCYIRAISLPPIKLSSSSDQTSNRSTPVPESNPSSPERLTRELIASDSVPVTAKVAPRISATVEVERRAISSSPPSSRKFGHIVEDFPYRKKPSLTAAELLAKVRAKKSKSGDSNDGDVEGTFLKEVQELTRPRPEDLPATEKPELVQGASRKSPINIQQMMENFREHMAQVSARKVQDASWIKYHPPYYPPPVVPYASFYGGVVPPPPPLAAPFPFPPLPPQLRPPLRIESGRTSVGKEESAVKPSVESLQESSSKQARGTSGELKSDSITSQEHTATQRDGAESVITTSVLEDSRHSTSDMGLGQTIKMESREPDTGRDPQTPEGPSVCGTPQASGTPGTPYYSLPATPQTAISHAPTEWFTPLQEFAGQIAKSKQSRKSMLVLTAVDSPADTPLTGDDEVTTVKNTEELAAPSSLDKTLLQESSMSDKDGEPSHLCESKPTSSGTKRKSEHRESSHGHRKSRRRSSSSSKHHKSDHHRRSSDRHSSERKHHKSEKESKKEKKEKRKVKEGKDGSDKSKKAKVAYEPISPTFCSGLSSSSDSIDLKEKMKQSRRSAESSSKSSTPLLESPYKISSKEQTPENPGEKFSEGCSKSSYSIGSAREEVRGSHQVETAASTPAEEQQDRENRRGSNKGGKPSGSCGTEEGCGSEDEGAADLTPEILRGEGAPDLSFERFESPLIELPISPYKSTTRFPASLLEETKLSKRQCTIPGHCGKEDMDCVAACEPAPNLNLSNLFRSCVQDETTNEGSLGSNMTPEMNQESQDHTLQLSNTPRGVQETSTSDLGLGSTERDPTVTENPVFKAPFQRDCVSVSSHCIDGQHCEPGESVTGQVESTGESQSSNCDPLCGNVQTFQTGCGEFIPLVTKSPQNADTVTGPPVEEIQTGTITVDDVPVPLKVGNASDTAENHSASELGDETPLKALTCSQSSQSCKPPTNTLQSDRTVISPAPQRVGSETHKSGPCVTKPTEDVIELEEGEILDDKDSIVLVSVTEPCWNRLSERRVIVLNDSPQPKRPVIIDLTSDTPKEICSISQVTRCLESAVKSATTRRPSIPREDDVSKPPSPIQSKGSESHTSPKSLEQKSAVASHKKSKGSKSPSPVKFPISSGSHISPISPEFLAHKHEVLLSVVESNLNKAPPSLVKSPRVERSMSQELASPPLTALLPQKSHDSSPDTPFWEPITPVSKPSSPNRSPNANSRNSSPNLAVSASSSSPLLSNVTTSESVPHPSSPDAQTRAHQCMFSPITSPPGPFDHHHSATFQSQSEAPVETPPTAASTCEMDTDNSTVEMEIDDSTSSPISPSPPPPLPLSPPPPLVPPPPPPLSSASPTVPAVSPILSVASGAGPNQACPDHHKSTVCVSYIEMIARAVLGSPDERLPFQYICASIEENFPKHCNIYPNWRTAVQQCLSTHNCFCKGEKSKSMGHYWHVHPNYLEKFQGGDFKMLKWHVQREPRLLSLHQPQPISSQPLFPTPPCVPSKDPGPQIEVLSPPGPQGGGPPQEPQPLMSMAFPKQAPSLSSSPHQHFETTSARVPILDPSVGMGPPPPVSILPKCVWDLNVRMGPPPPVSAPPGPCMLDPNMRMGPFPLISASPEPRMLDPIVRMGPFPLVSASPEPRMLDLNVRMGPPPPVPTPPGPCMLDPNVRMGLFPPVSASTECLWDPNVRMGPLPPVPAPPGPRMLDPNVRMGPLPPVSAPPECLWDPNMGMGPPPPVSTPPGPHMLDPNVRMGPPPPVSTPPGPRMLDLNVRMGPLPPVSASTKCLWDPNMGMHPPTEHQATVRGNFSVQMHKRIHTLSMLVSQFSTEAAQPQFPSVPSAATTLSPAVPQSFVSPTEAFYQPHPFITDQMALSTSTPTLCMAPSIATASQGALQRLVSPLQTTEVEATKSVCAPVSQLEERELQKDQEDASEQEAAGGERLKEAGHGLRDESEHVGNTLELRKEVQVGGELGRDGTVHSTESEACSLNQVPTLLNTLSEDLSSKGTPVSLQTQVLRRRHATAPLVEPKVLQRAKKEPQHLKQISASAPELELAANKTSRLRKGEMGERMASAPPSLELGESRREIRRPEPQRKVSAPLPELKQDASRLRELELARKKTSASPCLSLEESRREIRSSKQVSVPPAEFERSRREILKPTREREVELFTRKASMLELERPRRPPSRELWSREPDLPRRVSTPPSPLHSPLRSSSPHPHYPYRIPPRGLLRDPDLFNDFFSDEPRPSHRHSSPWGPPPHAPLPPLRHFPLPPPSRRWWGSPPYDSPYDPPTSSDRSRNYFGYKFFDY